MSALSELKAITIQMKNNLLRGNLDDFGELLDAGWQNKRRLAAGIATPEIDELYEVARRNGAQGGKICGAGGGGYIMFCCEFDKRHRLAEAVERLGAQVVEFGFEPSGIQAWETASPKVSPTPVLAVR